MIRLKSKNAFIFLNFSILIMSVLVGCNTVQKPVLASEPTSLAEPIELIVPFEIQLTEVPMKDPYGIAINSSGLIFISDAGNNRVVVLDDERS